MYIYMIAIIFLVWLDVEDHNRLGSYEVDEKIRMDVKKMVMDDDLNYA